MNQFFADMLHGRLSTEVPQGQGRVVSFSGGDSDIRLITGSMRERVLGYLYVNAVPSTSREIASGIKSNPSRVTKTLKDLIAYGEVAPIKHEGCVAEYELKPAGLKTLKASDVFAELKP